MSELNHKSKIVNISTNKSVSPFYHEYDSKLVGDFQFITENLNQNS